MSNLTREEAQERSHLLEVDDYQVHLTLDGLGETFRSVSTINFAATPGAATFVDLIAQQINRATLNGVPLPADAYSNHRLELGDLKANNTLFVDADCRYMNTGEGMHRSVDPADGETYLYTQFETADARRVFPTFEQPDLKASFTFTVTVPKGWTVFSNSPTPKPTDEHGQATYRFAPTPRISTYITAIVAGPYQGYNRTIRSVDGREVELGVYCRQSLLPHLDAEEIFTVTEAGFTFFEETFAVPYPFVKYDQIFVPEYNAGAMENAGCVTLRDEYVYRSHATDWELENRTNTILHELAHMWFGNLVTMTWWDDLWLKESFAEYMAHLAAAEATRWSSAWVGFLGRKEWGMAQDQRPTTHPVKANMKDLDAVDVNFDGITYAKGAAVLRQMVSYVGEENFFSALNRYLNRHAWANATLADLLEELEKTSGRDMGAWAQVWLEEPGVTLLAPELVVDSAGNLEELRILQQAPPLEQVGQRVELRPHRLAVSGYNLDEDEKRLDQVFTQEMDVKGPSTIVPGIAGLPRPDLLVVNDGDLAYAKVRLDPSSFAFAAEHVHLVTDPVTRRVILASAWDMTRDGELPARDFLTLALRALQAEDSISTVTTLLAQVDRAVTTFVPAAERSSQLETVAQELFSLLAAAKPGSDRQHLLVRAVARRAVTREQYQVLARLYLEEPSSFNLKLNMDLRWQLLFALVRGGLAGPDEVRNLADLDTTLTGKQNTARALASSDDPQVRESTWEAVLWDPEIPNEHRWALAAGFWAHAVSSPSQYSRFAVDFFGSVASVWAQHTFHTASRIVEIMSPANLAGYLPEVDVVELAKRWSVENPDQPSSLRRLIVEVQDDALRQVQAQRA